jgi:hypothetical protein
VALQASGHQPGVGGAYLHGAATLDGGAITDFT